MPKHKTRITVETHSTTVVRSRGLIAWCSVGEAETQWLTVEQAAIISSLTQDTILTMVQTQCLHFNDNSDLLICLECLQHLNSNVTSGDEV